MYGLVAPADQIPAQSRDYDGHCPRCRKPLDWADRCANTGCRLSYRYGQVDLYLNPGMAGQVGSPSALTLDEVEANLTG